jgi:glycine cleavage system aminomethyltransferase T
MAFIDTDADLKVGEDVVIEMRGRRLPARVADLPFVHAGSRARPKGAP